MAKKKSHDPNFHVVATEGKAAEGEDSLLVQNNLIQAAKETKDIFVPIKRICAAMAIHRKITVPGICKIRQGGSPDDFLTFATLSYVTRWKKQFEPAHARKPVAFIQNWIPYISNTIRYCLINYNKEVQDYDFLPLPNHFTDSVNGETEDDDLLCNNYSYNKSELLLSMNRESIHDIVRRLPKEMQPYLADILYYIRKKGTKMVNDKYRNFVIIGANIFNEEFSKWIK